MARILIVDDDPVVVRLVQEVLTNEGHEVATASDGLDAMVRVQKDLPDLIVLDVMMPELNGFDVCHKIKFNDQTKHVPILLLTSRDQDLDPRLGKVMGIDYLHKPCSARDLVVRVKALLRSGE
ncbi:MAG: response regulator [Elusimicrobia bacterium]|nr:response regulator [Elusimicrobiota bacterium]